MQPLAQTRAPRVLAWLAGRDPSPTEAEYQELGAALWAGDGPMDRFIAAAQASGQAGKHWAELRRLQEGTLPVDQVTLPELQALYESAASPPFPVDWAEVDAGCRFIQALGRQATDVLRDMCLLGGYYLSGLNPPLVLTGELDRGASSRLARTSQWWLSVTEMGANRPGKAGFGATLRVRWIHGMVRARLSRDARWRAKAWGLAINQLDMAATYLGFCLVMLLGVRKLGVWVTKRQSQAVMHAWKVIAWQLGVEARWLVDDERAGLALLWHCAVTHGPPDESGWSLAAALAKEPLQRHFGRFEGVRQKWAYLFHLSSASWLIGPPFFKALRLSSPTGPWLRLLSLPVSMMRYYASFLLGSARQAVWGRAAQRVAAAEIHTDPETPGAHGG